MMEHMISRAVIAGAALVVLLGACSPGPAGGSGGGGTGRGGTTAGPGPEARSGSASPDRSGGANDFSVQTFGAAPFRLSHHRGTPVVLNFWESW